MSTAHKETGPSPKEFGALIRRLRNEQALSVAEFGQRAGLSVVKVEALENGCSEFDMNELFAIGRGLGMHVSTIFRVRDARRSAK